MSSATSIFLLLCLASGLEASEITSYIFIVPDYKQNSATAWCKVFEEIESSSNIVNTFNMAEHSQSTYEDTVSNKLAITNELADFMRSKIQGEEVTYVALFGLGLGAHIAGMAAQILKTEINVTTIVGFDPSGPLFENLAPDQRLSEDDAVIVVALHTNEGKYGINHNVGRWDIYATNWVVDDTKEPEYLISNMVTTETDFTRHTIAPILWMEYSALRMWQVCAEDDSNCDNAQRYYTKFPSGRYQFVRAYHYAIIYHGYKETSQATWYQQLKGIYENLNITVELIDWSQNNQDTYEETARKVPEFAAATVSDWHIENMKNVREIYVIGYDLGAHVAATAIKEYRKRTGQNVYTFYALDPSGYMFENTGSDIYWAAANSDNMVIFRTNDGKYGFAGELLGITIYPDVTTCITTGRGYDIPGRNVTDLDFCKHEQVLEHFLSTV